jgi:ribosomal protein S19
MTTRKKPTTPTRPQIAEGPKKMVPSTRQQKQLSDGAFGTYSSSTAKWTRGGVSLWTKKLFTLEFHESCEKDPTLAPTVVCKRPHFNLSQNQVGDILFFEEEILAKVDEMGEVEAKKRIRLHVRPMLVLEQMQFLAFQQKVANSKLYPLSITDCFVLIILFVKFLTCTFTQRFL